MTFDEAYKFFYPRIVSYCEGYTQNDRFFAEELADDAFVSLNEKWDTLESHEPPALRIWLIRCAHFKCLEFLRIRRPDTLPFEDDLTQNMIAKRMLEDLSIPDKFEEDLKFKAYTKEIKAFLKKRDERKLFIYVIVKEYKHKKIASRLNVSEDAVKMRWMRLRQKLKPYVEKLIDRNL